MKKTLIGGIAAIAAAMGIAACATNAHADNDGYHGSKGDHDARAYWLDSGPDPLNRPNDPARYAGTLCSVRSQVLSDEQVLSAMTHDLHGNYIGTPPNAMKQIRAAEYHFCPKYY